MKDLAGRTAVITGGASGIGLAVAKRLAGEGMNLVLGDIEQPALDQVVVEFEAADVPVIGVEVDVSDLDAVRGLAAAATGRLGISTCCSTTLASVAADPCLSPTTSLYGSGCWGSI